jgi:hypothetical protein
MKTNAEPKPATSSPVPSPKAPRAAAAAPLTSAPATKSMGGVARAPSVAQPAGSRFRAPDAPSMAPKGTPATTRRLDKTP